MLLEFIRVLFLSISQRLCFPFFSITFLINTRNHEGTPERLVTFSIRVVSTISLSLLSQSDIRSISFEGTRIKSSNIGAFRTSIAGRSPVGNVGFIGLGAWLPATLISLLRNKRLCVFWVIHSFAHSFHSYYFDCLRCSCLFG